ncbi:MAG: peptidase M14 family protein, partial [Candidatus Aminicenantaceae bacterium]
MRNPARFFHYLFGCLVILIFSVVSISPAAGAQQKVTSPEDFFGFQLGSDRNIARWDKIVDYYYLLEKESDKLKVINMGPSTEGNPFLVVIISSADNLANLSRLQEVNAKISDPRGIEESEIKKLVKEGKAVICQSMSLHATEIG